MSGLSDLGSRAGLAPLALLGAPLTIRAQTDEIQVYDAEIAAQGIFNLMIHTNFTPVGRKTPDFPGAIIANDSVNGAAEWAYGVTPWFEQGLYMPVYSFYSTNQGATINGFRFANCSCGRMRASTSSSMGSILSSVSMRCTGKTGGLLRRFGRLLARIWDVGI